MEFLKSTIGKKYLLGLAGLVWTGFVAVHMAGNLLIFAGAEAYNKYSHAIVSNKPLLYGTEIILLLAIIAHAGLGILLTIENKKAKPQGYAVPANYSKKARFASKTMAVHGTIILFFIIYHLITFKYGPHYSVVYDGVEMRDLHRLMIEVFASPAYVVGYTICLILLGVHLSHGFSSVFQSFGINHPKYNMAIRKVGWAYAIIISLGFISQPLYFFLNEVQ